MKNPRTHFNFFLFSLMCSTMFAQTAERTLVKSFNLKGNNTVVLDLKGEVDVQQWKSELVRIQININLEDGTEAILKSLIIAGRYNLKHSVEEDVYVINSPGLHRGVKVKNTILKEQLSYTVFVPENVLVQMGDKSATKLEKVEENSSSL